MMLPKPSFEVDIQIQTHKYGVYYNILYIIILYLYNIVYIHTHVLLL